MRWFITFSIFVIACDGAPGGPAPTGIYDLDIEATADDCEPPQPVGSLEGLAIVSMTDQLVVPYLENSPSAALVRLELVRGVENTFERGVCSGAGLERRQLVIEQESGDAISVHAIERWSGVVACNDPTISVAGDCQSERTLSYALVTACETPCELVPSNPPDLSSGVECKCP